MQATQADPLRQEIAKLGEMLGETIREIAGVEAFQIVEDIRRLAWDRRRGDAKAGEQLTQLLASLHDEHLRVVIRAFSLFLDLANLAEDRQRVRVLRKRANQAFPGPPSESVREGVERLRQGGRTANQMQQLLAQLNLELVFTAHPTEAKRRSVRSKLRKIRNLLYAADLSPSALEEASGDQLMQAELAKLWQTDVIRPWRPSVMQEVNRGLSIKPVLWEIVPRMMQDIRRTLDIAYPGESVTLSPCVTFGTWIGGDRDGHPFVTPDVTRQTFLWLREAALDFQLSACSELFDSLSLSQRQVKLGEDLPDGITAACDQWPQLDAEIREVPPNEVCRRWLRMIRWRLQQTQSLNPGATLVEGAYASTAELADQVTKLRDALAALPIGQLLAEEVQTWLDRIHTFGFHLARLDVRQDARQYRSIADELFQQTGLCSDPTKLDEQQRQDLLVSSLDQRFEFNVGELSAEAQEAIELFELLHQVVSAFGSQALGAHVISMTHAPSDVVTVLWLWRQTAGESKPAEPQEDHCLPIVPLFETIEDLRHGPEILTGMLRVPAYRENVRRLQDRQTVMLGYSDSTKDGGYLSACWSLYEAQQRLQAAALDQGIELTFFHGRGGSLGRGGGPAARSILSLPAGTFRGSLRLTEQGEVLADRYDDPNIAHRHLEQVVWSSLMACGQPAEPPPESSVELLKRLDQVSFDAYRELVEQPDFVEYFRRATPIAEVEQLPLGSRPARRRGGHGLSDLRAIPWVFSWTQCRCLIPAWYGFGSATRELVEQPASLTLLQSMYRDWPFFRATIDNAELALAKTDLSITDEYAQLVEGSDSLTRIGAMISSEYVRSRDAILAITECEALLDGTSWLQESIRVRNRYIDPLNLIQVELLRRSRRQSERGGEPDEELQHLTRLTIKGLAAGMRTTG